MIGHHPSGWRDADHAPAGRLACAVRARGRRGRPPPVGPPPRRGGLARPHRARRFGAGRRAEY